MPFQLGATRKLLAWERREGREGDVIYGDMFSFLGLSKTFHWLSGSQRKVPRNCFDFLSRNPSRGSSQQDCQAFVTVLAENITPKSRAASAVSVRNIDFRDRDCEQGSIPEDYYYGAGHAQLDPGPVPLLVQITMWLHDRKHVLSRVRNMRHIAIGCLL